jgi:tetratricopeptide (TPR) repeat protein
MSTPKFLACIVLIVAAGVVLRWSSSLPDLSAAEHIERGDALAKQRKHEEAIRHFTAALAKDPRNIRALNLRAAAYVSQKKIVLALTDLENAIYFSKGTSRDSFVLRAFIHEVAGYFEEALADANKAVELDPTHYDGYGLRAAILLHPEKGDVKKSQQDWEKAVSLAPELKGKLPADLFTSRAARH